MRLLLLPLALIIALVLWRLRRAAEVWSRGVYGPEPYASVRLAGTDHPLRVADIDRDWLVERDW